MAARLCPHPGCPTLTRGGPCPTPARPSPEARGYDAQHRRERAAWKQRIDAGEQINCWRCGESVEPGAWDLGHVHDERDTETRRADRWPEHDRRCNRAAAGRARHA